MCISNNIWITFAFVNDTFPESPLMYLKIPTITYQWVSHGKFKNWLAITTYLIFGLIMVKKFSLPTNLLYFLGSKKDHPWSIRNLIFGSIGCQLDFNIAYQFLLRYPKHIWVWEITTPALYWAASMPIKYRIFFLYFWLEGVEWMLFKSHNYIMIFTCNDYIIHIQNHINAFVRWEFIKYRVIRFILNHSIMLNCNTKSREPCWGDYLRPYKALWKFYTYPRHPLEKKPHGCSK